MRTTKGNVFIVSGETLSGVASNQYNLYAVVGDGGATVILGYTLNKESESSLIILIQMVLTLIKWSVPGILPPTKGSLRKRIFFKSTGDLNSVIESKWKKNS